ncbi:MAG: phosphatidate cytidylyltransferase [Clostridia bacterium]|nr:phosphatidate cytidylyltransferase [Clostridia bacterium]
MSKHKIRIISALIGAVFVIALIFCKAWIFHIIVAAACLIMLHELQVTFKLDKKWQVVVPCYIFAIGYLIFPAIWPYGWQMFVPTLLVLQLMVLMIISVICHEKICFSDVVSSFFAVIYAVLFPMHLTYIRQMDHGIALLFIPFLGAWMPDTFAYFAGRMFGKHKLIPGVSPNKTVEGAIGGVLGPVVTFLLYGLVLSFGFQFTVNYLSLMGLALICGVVAQFGDLSASVIKRATGIKDFGNLIPGHGGMLDRIDSLVFIAPVVYYFLLMFEVICK